MKDKCVWTGLCFGLNLLIDFVHTMQTFSSHFIFCHTQLCYSKYLRQQGNAKTKRNACLSMPSQKVATQQQHSTSGSWGTNTWLTCEHAIKTDSNSLQHNGSPPVSFSFSVTCSKSDTTIAMMCKARSLCCIVFKTSMSPVHTNKLFLNSTLEGEKTDNF